MSENADDVFASIEAQVIELVVDAAETRLERVTSSSRLGEDLGMDGADAAQFFGRVQERFGTDLTQLHQHWENHFGPEGIPCSAGFIFIPAAFAGGLASAAGRSTFGGVAVAVAILLGSVGIMRLLGVGRTAPITVGDVVRAVEAGAWPSQATSHEPV